MVIIVLKLLWNDFVIELTARFFSTIIIFKRFNKKQVYGVKIPLLQEKTMTFGQYRFDIQGKILVALILFAGVALSGCQGLSGPRMRIGSFYGDLAGLDFPEPTELGTHHRGYSLKEKKRLTLYLQGRFYRYGPPAGSG